MQHPSHLLLVQALWGTSWKASTGRTATTTAHLVGLKQNMCSLRPTGRILWGSLQAPPTCLSRRVLRARVGVFWNGPLRPRRSTQPRPLRSQLKSQAQKRLLCLPCPWSRRRKKSQGLSPMCLACANPFMSLRPPLLQNPRVALKPCGVYSAM